MASAAQHLVDRVLALDVPIGQCVVSPPFELRDLIVEMCGTRATSAAPDEVARAAEVVFLALPGGVTVDVAKVAKDERSRRSSCRGDDDSRRLSS